MITVLNGQLFRIFLTSKNQKMRFSVKTRLKKGSPSGSYAKIKYIYFIRFYGLKQETAYKTSFWNNSLPLMFAMRHGQSKIADNLSGLFLIVFPGYL